MLHFVKDFLTNKQILGIIKLEGKPTPTLDLFRSNGEKLKAEKVSHYEKKHVLDNGQLTASLDASANTITVNEELAKFINKGHLIAIGDEYFAVDSVDVSSKTITVKGRGYGGTPVTTHNSGEAVYVISKVEGEGVITEDYRKTISLEIQNFLQENTKSVYITERAANLSQKDFTDLEMEETAAKINEQAQELNRSVLYSVGHFDSDEKRHTMSGLKHLITSNGGFVLDAEGDLTDEKLDLLCAQIINAGGDIDTFIMNPLSIHKVFKKMQHTITVPRDQMGNDVAGGVVSGYMPSTMGGKQVKFITDKDCRPGDIFVVNSEALYFLPLVDKSTGEDEVMRVVEETNSSSAVINKTIRTVGTIKVDNASKMAYITNA